MTSFWSRRLINLGLTALAVAAVVMLNRLYEMSLRDSAFFDGWVLLVALLFLTLFNLRKKIPIVPMLSAATWLQLHIYGGIFCVVLFLVHSRFRLPDGFLETALWLGFVAVTLSGALGLVLSRHLPPRVSTAGERIIFERLPAFRGQLAQRAQDLAVESVSLSGSSVIADFYSTQLASYFAKPRDLWSHLVERDVPLRRLQSQIAELGRFQDDRGRDILAEIDDLVETKHNLDHQYALQLVLKGWLFVHIPLAYGVVTLSLGHVLIVYAFASGSP